MKSLILCTALLIASNCLSMELEEDQQLAHLLGQKLTSASTDDEKQAITEELFTAIEKGNLAIINKLPASGITVNTKNKHGATVLFPAACNGHLAIVNRLIELGANINTTDNIGNTALFYAAFNGHLSIINRFIELGANINAKGNSGITALLIAAFNGHLAIVNKLIEHGADINAKDNYGQTALFHAARSGQLAVVNRLIELGTDINATNKSGKTVLFHAANNEHLATVNKLIEHGADINAKDNYGQNALFNAAFNGHSNVVNGLIELGADINATDKAGQTALFYAANNEHLATVNKLIELGAHINATDINTLPLRFKNRFTWMDNEDTRKFYSDRKKEIEKYSTQLKASKYWRQCTKDTQQNLHTSCKHSTPLILACMLGDSNSTKELLACNPPCWYIQAQDHLGRTASMYAILYTYTKCITTLLAHIRGIITSKDTDAAHIARLKRSMNLQDEEGLTLLDYAIDANNCSLAHELIALGCHCLPRHIKRAAEHGFYHMVIALFSTHNTFKNVLLFK